MNSGQKADLHNYFWLNLVPYSINITSKPHQILFIAPPLELTLIFSVECSMSIATSLAKLMEQ